MRGSTKKPGLELTAWALPLLLCACSTNGRLLDTEKQGPAKEAPSNTPPPASPDAGSMASAPKDAALPSMVPTMVPSMPAMTAMPPQPVNTLPPDPNKPADPAMPVPSVSTVGMPADVALILQARCSSCHTYGQGDLAGWGSVLDLSRMIDAEIVVPGNAAASRMIDRVQVRGDMPPKGDRVPADDVAKLRAWITSLKRPVATPRNDEDILDLIATDVNKQRSFNSDFRYFSLAHFIDQGRPDKELSVAKNALGFLVNSLSRRGTIVPMVPIDAAGSIFRIRLSDLGWDARLWDTLTGFYPFCLASDVAGHQSLYAQLGTEAPFVRGDWLLDTASRAPLYDLLLNLPSNLNDLGRQLGIDIAGDINHIGLAEPDNLVRFAVQRSGVALHNRMAERHLGAAGQYLWISYDFKSDSGRQDIFANPLGPRAVDQNKFVHTFENDAGEVIFTMPNGMQGYMLVNAQGQKIAIADTAIVKDIRRPNASVENGISCFGCHGGTGMIRPRDTDEMKLYLNTHVADFTRNEFNEVSVLYPPLFQPDLFGLDSNRYRGIIESLDGGGPARTAEYTEFVALVGDYESNLGFRGVAAEFNEDPATFTDLVLANDFQNRAFPRTPAEPLISRVDFICAFRDLAPKIRPQRFCAKTFDAAAVQGLCR
jgi:mono/diheme cytochrome c family protein